MKYLRNLFQYKPFTIAKALSIPAVVVFVVLLAWPVTMSFADSPYVQYVLPPDPSEEARRDFLFGLSSQTIFLLTGGVVFVLELILLLGLRAARKRARIEAAQSAYDS